MNAKNFNRLHALRMENDAAKYAQEEMRPRFDRIAGRHENGTAPRAVSAFNLFQTPPELAARLVALLDLNRNTRVLEPSAGLGRLLDAISPHAWDVTAVEIAPQLCAELYKQERPEVKLLQRDFLTCTPDELGQFHAIAMNPPFHMRADIRHIEHALKFLRPGGSLAALCLNTRHRSQALRYRASEWIEIDNAFRHEGTSVSVILLKIEG